jgi:antitoxin component YwqK of YwqJK toxin-antitoxin module
MKLSELLNLTDEQKEKGVWFSGIAGEGEYKEWYGNGTLFEHSNWKDGKLHGEYKMWHKNGVLAEHSFRKDGERHGEYKRWWNDGTLRYHSFYKKGKLIERII